MSADVLRCIVFDIDDTLYLERDYVRSGFGVVDGWVAERLGIVDFADRAWALFEQGVRARVFDSVFASCGIVADERLITEAIAVYRHHVPDIGLTPDSDAALEHLARHVALAAITDGPLESQWRKVAALGLSDRLDPIIYTAALGDGNGKPSQTAFRMVEDALGCRGGACVYVADNPAKDFDGPRALGWMTVRIRRAGSLHEDVDSGQVDLEVPTMTHFVDGLRGPGILPPLRQRMLR